MYIYRHTVHRVLEKKIIIEVNIEGDLVLIIWVVLLTRENYKITNRKTRTIVCLLIVLNCIHVRVIPFNVYFILISIIW